MRNFVLITLSIMMPVACADFGGHHGSLYSDWRRYDYDRPDPAYGAYHADRYYRRDTRYRERVLTRSDRIYRGMDGRYYCRRPDGTTGLVIGAITGAVLGNVITRGDSKTIGTILGATAGALLGRQIDRGEAKCR